MQKLLHPKIIILLCIAICVFVTTNIHWGKDKWQNIIEADARGYYAYLPATFIYQDLNFTFYDTVEKEKYNTSFNYDYRVNAQGKTINKYFCGTAILQSPFFFIAHILASVSDHSADGYSRIYMLLITIAGIFYLMVGLLYTDKLLQLFSIREGIRSIALISILFGTNLFFYSVCEMGMSHIYSFAAISMFCYFIKKWFTGLETKHLIISMLILGVIFLIRPSNLMIVLIIPFLAGDLYRIFIVFKKMKKELVLVIIGVLCMIIIMAIQPLIYKISTGSFRADSYPGEEFHFTSPNFLNILFSFKKGLFLYTPMYLASLIGLFFLWKKRKFEFFTFIFFFLALTYILSCWWNWWYGGSFSSRVYVEYLPLFCLLLAILLQNASEKILRSILLPLIFLLIGLCQFQTYQYRYYVIHWEDMTKEKYIDSFLSMDKKAQQ
jgi:hypothetical protein